MSFKSLVKPLPSGKRRVRRFGYSSWLSVTSLGLVGLAALLAVAPLGVVIVRELFPGGRFHSEAFASVLEMSRLERIVLDTATAVGVGGAIALILGASLAWLNLKSDAQLGRWGDALALAPLIIPPLGISLGWVFLLSPKGGWINIVFRTVLEFFGVDISTGPLDIYTWPGLIFLFVLSLTPYAYLIVSAGLVNTDPSLEEASRMSGAGPWRTMGSISLRLAAPSMGAAIFVMVAIGLSLYSAPITVGEGSRITVLAVEVVRVVNGSFPPKLAEATVLSLIMLLGVLLAAVLNLVLQYLSGYRAAVQRSTGSGRGRLVRLGKARWIVKLTAISFVVLTCGLPVVGLVIVSFERFWIASLDGVQWTLANYQLLWESSYVQAGFRNSVTLAVLTAVICGIISIAMSVLARSRGVRLLELAISAPAGVPHLLIGIGIIATLASAPLRLPAEALLTIGYVVCYLPFCIVTVRAAIQKVPSELVEASRVSGGSEARALIDVVVPLIKPGLLTGATLVFVLVMGDLITSVLLASSRTPVIGFVMLNVFESGTFPQVAALGVILSLITGAVTLTVLRFSYRGIR